MWTSDYSTITTSIKQYDELSEAFEAISLDDPGIFYACREKPHKSLESNFVQGRTDLPGEFSIGEHLELKALHPRSALAHSVF